ncbi:MAG: esterase/lipase [Myxococcota bacterium]|jgi:esterase/lipase
MPRPLRTIVMLSLMLAGCARKPPEVDLTNAASHVPDDDVDTWLARREAHITDITPGTEKTILRVSPDKTPISLVFLHGFSATRQELSPLCENLSQELGANAYFARLTGHGRSDDEMAEASVGAWMADVAEAMEIGRRIGEKVVVIGSSTGGTLAAWLASENPPDLAALVYISPNFALRDKRSRMMLWPGRRLLARIVIGTHREWQPKNELVGRYWTHRYPARALFPMIELVNHVQKIDLSQARQPAMVIYSPDDTIVDSAEIVARFAQMGASPKELLAITDANDTENHVLAGDLISPDTTAPITTAILSFLSQALAD